MTVHGKRDSGEVRSRTLDLLAQVRIPNPSKVISSYPHDLSGGMRQRVAIAMAMANNPELIIADEPTTALDVTVQAQILRLLDELRRETGMSLLFITHDFGVVSQICDTVAVMYAGQIVELAPVDRILKSPQHPYTKNLIRCVPKKSSIQSELFSIPGLPPSPDNLPSGCSFAPRCSGAKDKCRNTVPDWTGDFQSGYRCYFPESA